jgi:hypothetical protein
MEEFGKKKRIRNMRKTVRENPDGSVSSHVMSWTGDPTKKRGDYGVYPTIAPKEGKETSSNYEDWKEQTAKEAIDNGEFIKVNRKRRAERLAAGSWKKGEARREAMREYRNNK